MSLYVNLQVEIGQLLPFMIFAAFLQHPIRHGVFDRMVAGLAEGPVVAELLVFGVVTLRFAAED